MMVMVTNMDKTVESDCARVEWTPDATAVDRCKRIYAAGQGGCRPEIEQQPRQSLRQRRERRGGELLPLVHGTEVNRTRPSWAGLAICRFKLAFWIISVKKIAADSLMSSAKVEWNCCARCERDAHCNIQLA